MPLILLVDDDFENRSALQMALESRGHHVVVAENGRDALRQASRNVPQLIITDFQMPEMDGGQLCRHLKGRAHLSNIPVLLLSAVREPANVIRCWTAFLRKPVAMESLLSMVDAFIAGRRTSARVSRVAEYNMTSRWQGIDSRCWP